MALRILLADESATIKKVIELSLQDYAVELRIVNLGIDVLEVAKAFQPDVILADILLQKKNGYEVCHDIKSDEATKHMPVIILWSGFMELDKSKLDVVGADDTLEKPFDSDTLRSLIIKHTEKSEREENPLKEHLEIPSIPAPSEFTQVRSLDEINARLADQETAEEESEEAKQEQPKDWNMDSFDGLPELEYPDEQQDTLNGLPVYNSTDSDEDDEEDDFSHFEIKAPSLETAAKPDTMVEAGDDEAESDWVNQSLGKFQLDLPEEDNEMEELAGLEVGEVNEPIEDTSFLWNAEIAEELKNNSSEKNDSLNTIETEPLNQAEQESHPDLHELPPLSAVAKHPSEDEIFEAEELELDQHTDEAFQIEHNHELGIETIEHDSSVDSVSLDTGSPNQQSLDQFLSSEAFERILEQRLNQKLEEIAKRMIPELAKQSIEKEIKRLLDEPYQE